MRGRPGPGMTGRGVGTGGRQRRLVRTRRLETEDSSETQSDTQGDETSCHAYWPQPRPMASCEPESDNGGAPAPVISAVSQWRQRAARAGQCQSQAADCVIRGQQPLVGPACPVWREMCRGEEW